MDKEIIKGGQLLIQLAFFMEGLMDKDGWKYVGALERNKKVIKAKIEAVIKEYMEIMKIADNELKGTVKDDLVKQVENLIKNECLNIVKKVHDAKVTIEIEEINKEIETGGRFRLHNE